MQQDIPSSVCKILEVHAHVMSYLRWWRPNAIKSLLVAFFFLLDGGLLEEAGPSPTSFLFPDFLLFCFRFCLDFLLGAIMQNVFE